MAQRKTGKAWYYSSRASCQVDVGGGGGGGGQPQIGLKPQISLNRRRSCVDHLRVATSRGVFEPSQLDDEHPSGPDDMTTGPTPLHPPRVHPTSLT